MALDYDLIIRSGNLADGTGAALRETDIAVVGGCIEAVGDFVGSARQEFDAKDLLCIPSVVDIHKH